MTGFVTFLQQDCDFPDSLSNGRRAVCQSYSTREGDCNQGGPNPTAKKLRKIAVLQPTLPKPQGATLLHRWLRIFLCLLKHGRQVSQLLPVTLNITMESKHEPKAADIVIQFVLPLGIAPHCEKKRSTSPRFTLQAIDTNKHASWTVQKQLQKKKSGNCEIAGNCEKLRTAIFPHTPDTGFAQCRPSPDNCSRTVWILWSTKGNEKKFGRSGVGGSLKAGW